MPALAYLLREYATGRNSFRTLPQDLNAKGYRTSGKQPFIESSISTIVNNHFYSGKAVYHRGQLDEKVYQGVHEVPAMVGELWAKCQEVPSEKRRPGQPSPLPKQQRVYLLTGVFVCDGCGQPIHGITHRSRKTKTRRMSHNRHRCSMQPASIDATKVDPNS